MSSKKTKTSSRAVKTNTSNAKGVKVAKTRTVAGHVPASEQCEHKLAKHHYQGQVRNVLQRSEKQQADR